MPSLMNNIVLPSLMYTFNSILSEIPENHFMITIDSL